MDSGSNPSARSPSFRSPFWPKMAIKPSTATMTGKINGAPKSMMVTSRPQKRLLARARASGMANRTDRAADSAACKSVKRSAAHSAGSNRTAGPAFAHTAASGAITNAASAAPAIIWTARGAIPQSFPRANLRLRLRNKTGPFLAVEALETPRATLAQAALQAATNCLWGSGFETYRSG